jgi:hypothetical protein
MGYYTCKLLCCALKKDTPENVINTIKALVNHDDIPSDSVLSESDFETYRYGLSGYVNSYFIPNHRMEYDEHLGWRIFVNGESKDYEDEFERFLEWLKPYISCGIGVDDMYAMTIGEADNEPIIYKLHEGMEY